MKYKFITHHLDWIKQGLNYKDILAIREELKQKYNLYRVDSEMVQQHLSLRSPSLVNKNKFSIRDLTFLILNDTDFQQDLDFLNEANNLHTLIASGKNSSTKISSLRSIGHLQNLKRVLLDHQEISDLEPLSELMELKELDFQGNAIDSIYPLVHHQNLERAKFSTVHEKEVVPLLQHSQQAVVSYNQHHTQEVRYEAFWVNQWVFKARFIPEGSKVAVFIEPVEGQVAEGLQLTAPENLRALIIRAGEIASTYMGQESKIKDSRFTYREISNSLEGVFHFKKGDQEVN